MTYPKRIKRRTPQKVLQGLTSMNQVMRTDYFSAWLDKTGMREELSTAKGEEPWTAKRFRQYLDDHHARLGLKNPELRRLKRAAILVLAQL